MFLDVLAEERWVGETENVAYLLDAVVGVLQIISDVLHHMLRYPFVGSLTRMLFADYGEVLGRDTKCTAEPTLLCTQKKSGREPSGLFIQ